MPRTTGFDHVATVTADLDRITAFYQHVFDARITMEMAATQTHPRMVILDQYCPTIGPWLMTKPSPGGSGT